MLETMRTSTCQKLHENNDNHDLSSHIAVTIVGDNVENMTADSDDNSATSLKSRCSRRSARIAERSAASLQKEFSDCSSSETVRYVCVM